MKKMIKYVITDILRNKIVIAYTLFLLAISLSVFNLDDNPAKGLLSLLNLVLIIVPLVSIVFSTIYIYNSSEFIELLVSQPLKRKKIWTSLFFGLSGSLTLAVLTGVGIPIVLYSSNITGLVMIGMAALLTIIFVSIAMLAAVITRDKAKGIGVSILLWLYFSLLFDGLARCRELLVDLEVVVDVGDAGGAHAVSMTAPPRRRNISKADIRPDRSSAFRRAQEVPPPPARPRRAARPFW